MPNVFVVPDPSRVNEEKPLAESVSGFFVSAFPLP